MKKTFLTILAAATAISAVAVAPVAGPTTKVDLPNGSHHPVLSPDGSRMLFSSQDHQGLKSLSLVDGKVTTIDEGMAAGFEPVFSTDGSTVYYRTASMEKNLLQRDVRSFSFNDGTMRRLEPMSRRDVNLRSLAGNTYAMATYRTITVSVDGVNSEIAPLADSNSYLWASISPDGSRLLFCEPFEGVFVSNLDGTCARRILKKGDFPAWADNNTVVAVESHDDGYVILDSRLVAVNVVTGETTYITDEETKVSESTASAGRVVYTTLTGDMYMFNIYSAE